MSRVVVDLSVLLLLSLCAGNQGHLGDTTVEHAAHHLPVIVDELLHKLISTPDAPLPTPDTIREMLSSRITAFDNAIAGDVLELFPGGIESLPGLTDEEIQAVVNDFAVPGGGGSNGAGAGAGVNYKKARLCLYGTTALVALVDPAHENLWVANLGDCEAGTCLARKQRKLKNRVG
jgi:pyruvate dehydrogenase phosphatase